MIKLNYTINILNIQGKIGTNFVNNTNTSDEAMTLAVMNAIFAIA